MPSLKLCGHFPHAGVSASAYQPTKCMHHLKFLWMRHSKLRQKWIKEILHLAAMQSSSLCLRPGDFWSLWLNPFFCYYASLLFPKKSTMISESQNQLPQEKYAVNYFKELASQTCKDKKRQKRIRITESYSLWIKSKSNKFPNNYSYISIRN